MKKLLLIINVLIVPLCAVESDNDQLCRLWCSVEMNQCFPGHILEVLRAKILNDQEEISKQIDEVKKYPDQLTVPWITSSYATCIEQRKKALVETIRANAECSMLLCKVPEPLRMFLYDKYAWFVQEDNGTEFNHTIHFEILYVSSELMKMQEHNFVIPRINEFAKIAVEYNRIGRVDEAMALVEVCWAVLDRVTSMKMNLPEQDNQDLIALRLGKIWQLYGLKAKPISNKGSIAEQQRMKIQMVYEVINEKLHTIPTRDLLLTGNHEKNENYLMSKVLEEIGMICTMTMQVNSVN